MPNLLLLTVGTVALLSAVTMLTPRAEATMPTAPASIEITIGKTNLVEQARMACTHRRVCRQGAGCAWRKACKRDVNFDAVVLGSRAACSLPAAVTRSCRAVQP